MKINNLAIDIEVTRNCNFSCKYCFERPYVNTNNLRDPEKVLSTVENIINSKKWKSYTIGFWGGEPTLNMPVIDMFISKLKKYDNVKFYFYTNGSNVKDIISYYLELKDRVIIQISYDGNPIHDMNRLFKNNQPTSKTVLNSIDLLYKNKIDFHLKSSLPISGFPHMYDAYMDIKNNIYDKYNIVSNKFLYAVTIDYHDNNYLNNVNDDIHNQKLEELKTSLTKIAAEELKRIQNRQGPLFNWFDLTTKRHNVLCSAGAQLFCIDIYGDLRFCHGCMYTENPETDKLLKICNVYNNDIDYSSLLYDISKNFQSFAFTNNSVCESCAKEFNDNGVCFKCNAKVFIESKLTNFKDRWMDFPNRPKLCDFYKTASEVKNSFHYAANEIIKTCQN